jgi:hypothetical protein
MTVAIARDVHRKLKLLSAVEGLTVDELVHTACELLCDTYAAPPRRQGGRTDAKPARGARSRGVDSRDDCAAAAPAAAGALPLRTVAPASARTRTGRRVGCASDIPNPRTCRSGSREARAWSTAQPSAVPRRSLLSLRPHARRTLRREQPVPLGALCLSGVRGVRLRSEGVIRALQLAECLRAGRRSLDELATQFHVTTRTIRRDLEVLSVAGVPVRSTKDTPANGCTSYWWVGK